MPSWRARDAGCLRPDGLDAVPRRAVRRRRSSPRRPAYRKRNSHGEFVFDHAWAQAYAHYGVPYFPKWLGAVPYSPVTGPRLLARDDAARAALVLEAIVRFTREAGWSSAHVNFHRRRDARPSARWLPRGDVQYHWRNEAAGATSTITSPRWTTSTARTSARSARSSRAHGVDVPRRARRRGERRRPRGDARLLPADLRRIRQHAGADAGIPAAPRAAMPRALVLVLAERDGETIAGALCLRGGDTLYGRYWGANDEAARPAFRNLLLPGHRLLPARRPARFEPGAQGEHKVARGFLPTLVHSRHWIADPDFAEAIRPWCAEETAVGARYRGARARASPFRATRVRMPRARASAPIPIPSRRRNTRCANPTACSRSAAISRPGALLDAYRTGFSRGSRRPADPVVVAGSAHGVPHRWRAPVVALPPHACGHSAWTCAPTRASMTSSRACAKHPASRPARHVDHAGDARAYGELHRLGHAHSVEVFDGERLVGGIYGVSIGAMFFGESMFSAESGGSKVALAALAHRPGAPGRWGWPLIDAQVENDHLPTLGAESMPREVFLERVPALVQVQRRRKARSTGCSWTDRFGTHISAACARTPPATLAG
jgi:leucyl/phenylalanyl-tRNA--protein transferase